MEDDEQLAVIEAELLEMADEEHSSTADYWDTQVQEKGQELEAWLRLHAQTVAQLRAEYSEYMQ